MRIGHGYDVHRLVPGRKLILGGVHIPWEMGLLGHSDADVLAHAIADSLLGALAMGDIGLFFPDSDPAYKDADSLLLLQKTAQMLRDKGWKMENVEQVSVKATTEEGLGFTGKGEGLATHAVCLIEKN